MPIDFNKLPKTKPVKRAIEPIELFQSLKVTDTAINDLWLAQGDALRDWHKHRTFGDVAVVLNTGAGKTLVGLLCAQSLVNETNGCVLYACSSIQLVEQTASKAAGYGLDVTTYFKREFSNTLFQRGLAPCITTYHALFNGKSRFFKADVQAVVFDDAHAAEHLLRDHFTIRISRNTFADLYGHVVQLFRGYFERIGLGVGYCETCEQSEPYKQWFVPPFAVHEQTKELQRLLREADLAGSVDTMFAWEYLKDHIDLCACFVTGNEISLTPPVVPTRTLPYFDNSVRRLYLSATLSARDAFLRTFGRTADHIIAPATTAGECERLIIIPGIRDDCEDEVQVASQIVRKKKALILVPSYRRADIWSEILTATPAEDVTGQVESFKRANPPAKLLLVSRYDGVDLPGDTCRITIIDDLPASVGPLERYLWEGLGLVKQLRSTIASRVVQSFGRISRGMSDHGVVILTGDKLIDWVLSPRNVSVIPAFLRHQLAVGVELSKQAKSLSDLIEAADQCLSRDPNWVAYYTQVMAQSPPPVKSQDDQDALKLSKSEVEFGTALWLRDYVKAAKSLEQSLQETFEISQNTGAWHSLWLGYCYELLGDVNKAHELYRRAHSAAKNVPPFDLNPITGTGVEFPPQIIEVARYLQSGAGIRRDFLKEFDANLAALFGPATAAQIEEALRSLGEYLGLLASRPEKEYGTGPDVLWESVGRPALNGEVKAGKGEASCYRKEDLGQLRDHIRWVKSHGQAGQIYSAFIGPLVPPSPGCNPDPDTVVIELVEFKKLAERLRAALQDISSTALPLTLRRSILDNFRQRNLLWPELYDGLNKRLLTEIE